MLQSYILEIIATLSALALTYFNHTRTRSASTILLLYWPVYTLTLAVWIRTVVEGGSAVSHLTLALKCAAAGFGVLSFALECLGPQEPEGQPCKGAALDSPILSANVFSIWVCYKHIRATSCSILPSSFRG